MLEMLKILVALSIVEFKVLAEAEVAVRAPEPKIAPLRAARSRAFLNI
jgi:hypothetical protein